MYTICLHVYNGVGVMPDREMLSVRVPPELRDLVNSDERTNQQVVEAALWREFGGERKSALERRVEEQKRRESLIESERNERERELEEAQKKREALEEKLAKAEESRLKEREEWFVKVRQVPKDTSHPIITQAAEELDMTPENVITEAYDQ